MQKDQLGRASRANGLVSPGALVAKLKQCRRMKDLQGGKLLHSQAVEAGFHTDRYVAAALISMYSRSGSLHLARNVFDNMIQRDVVSWTALLLAYVENGECSMALEVFSCMDCAPDRVTLVAALKACAGLATDNSLERKRCLERGVSIHRQAKELGVEKEVVLASTLVNMYSKCGDMHNAREVFGGIQRKNVVTWNTLIIGYVENGEALLALELFNTMNCSQDSFTLVAAVKACGVLSETLEKKVCLEKGVAVHRRAKELGVDRNTFVANTLVDMYSKCGDMQNALQVFNGMVRRDAISWNALLLGYVENGESLVALEVLKKMECVPNRITFVAGLKACTNLSKLDKRASLHSGRGIHKRARELGFEKDVFVVSSLIDMYSNCGSMLDARNVFKDVRNPDAVCWNTLILGYVENQEFSVALEIFNCMNCSPDGATFVAALKACGGSAGESKVQRESSLQNGLTVHRLAKEAGLDRELSVANTLVDMYSKCGDMKLAKEVFDGIKNRDVVSWNALILGYVENDDSLTALEMFNCMNCTADVITYIAALKACSFLGALEAGQRIHDEVCELGLEKDKMVASCLVDFYGKCGNMPAAQEAFNRMLSHDIVSWSALIGGYSLVGDTSKVFTLVKRMQETGLRIDGVTVLQILAACSHAGMVEEGRRYFDSMGKCGIQASIEHYTCMVDMLGRANRLHEALSLVKAMPFEADGHVLMTLLGACRRWSNLEIGEMVFNALVTRNDDEYVAPAFSFMKSIYEKLGMVPEGNRVVSRGKNVKALSCKLGQTCWYDSKGQIHSFMI